MVKLTKLNPTKCWMSVMAMKMTLPEKNMLVYWIDESMMMWFSVGLNAIFGKQVVAINFFVIKFRNSAKNVWN